MTAYQLEISQKVSKWGEFMRIEYYFVLFLVALSGLFLFMTLKIPFQSTNMGSVGPGFFPRIIAVLLLALVVWYGIKIIRQKIEVDEEIFVKKALLPQLSLIVFLIVMIYLTQVIGMLVSIALFMFMMLTVFQKINWKNALVFTMLVMAVMYGIFEFWLDANLPAGVFFT